MKIAILSSTFFPRMGGAEITMHNLATALTHAGHAVHLIVPGSSKLSEFKPEYTFTPLVIPKGSVRLGVLEYVMFLNMVYLQKKYQFDLWQVFVTFPPGYAAYLGKKFLGVPVVIEATGKDIQVMPEIGYGLRLDPGVDAKVRKAVTGVDAVISLNQGMTDAYLEAGVAPQNLKFIRSSIWYERFQASKEQRDAIRADLFKEHGITQDGPLLLCTARNHPKKNYPTLLKALSLLIADGGEVPHLFIAGAETQLLEDQVRALRVEKYVHLLGTYPKQFGSFDKLPPQELCDLYIAADLYVLPTYIEGMPLVLLEAMAAGLPIMSTNVEGVNHIVTNDQEGILIDDPADVEAFAAAIRSVLADNTLKDRLSTSARTTAQQYDWTMVVKEFEALYEEVLAGYDKS